MIATSGTMVGKNSQVSPANSILRTMGSAAPLAFMAQPCRSGSTKVPRPTLVSTPGRLAAASRVQVEQDAGGHVVGGDPVVGDHLPDRRRRHRGRAARVGAGQHPGEQALLRQVVDALDAVHVAGGDRVDGGEVAGVAGAGEALADGGEHRVGAAEAARGADGDVAPSGISAAASAAERTLARAMGSASHRDLDRAAARRGVAHRQAVARDQRPSSPVAAGSPSPRTAAWNRRTRPVVELFWRTAAAPRRPQCAASPRRRAAAS